MIKNKFNLSKKIVDLKYPIKSECPTGMFCNYIHLVDVRNFIRLLKKEVIGKQGISEQDYVEILDGIDKLAGDILR